MIERKSPDDTKEHVPNTTINAFSRSIYKQASEYGFSQLDVIKLINSLMGLCGADKEKKIVREHGDNNQEQERPEEFRELPITGERISIRSFSGESDAELLESWLPDRYGRYFVLSCATAQQITVDSMVNSPSNILGIITRPDGHPIGAMAFLDHSKKQRRAELRKLIGDQNSRGSGLAEEATRLWVKYGLYGLGLEKIYVSTLQTQIANIKLNEDIGFEVEGLLRNEVMIDGVRHDVLRMGLSADKLEL